MPASPPTTAPRRPRLKFVLLGAAGGALVLLPMGQVLRHQTDELTALAVERAALDPMAHVVGVQRGVLAHREAADRVLRGRLALEPERRLLQAELDQRLRQLQDTLTAGWWMRALQESQSLAGDWRQLARRVALRQINAADSTGAHQLLMEQAVQVLDLVQASALPGLPAGSTAANTRALAALAARQLQGRAELPTAQRQSALATVEAALLQLDLSLAAREASIREQRAATSCALAALLALALTVAMRHLARTGPPGSDDPAQRRGHGRRATDVAPQRDEAAPLLDRLRSGDTTRAPETR